MTAMTSQHQHRYPSYAPARPQVVVITRRKYTPTTRVEYILLFLSIVLLPMEELLPNPGGFSSGFLLFAISSLYIVLQRVGSLTRVWNHPVLLLGYVLIFTSFILETSSPFASYQEIIRIAQMYIGAAIIATLCRDTR